MMKISSVTSSKNSESGPSVPRSSLFLGDTLDVICPCGQTITNSRYPVCLECWYSTHPNIRRAYTFNKKRRPATLAHMLSAAAARNPANAVIGAAAARNPATAGLGAAAKRKPKQEAK